MLVGSTCPGEGESKLGVGTLPALLGPLGSRVVLHDKQGDQRLDPSPKDRVGTGNRL